MYYGNPFIAFSGALTVWAGNSRIAFGPAARDVASSASEHPNIIPYPFFRRRAQVEVDTRFLSAHFDIDGEFHRAACDNAEFIMTRRLFSE
jgi:hypothetical protein